MNNFERFDLVKIITTFFVLLLTGFIVALLLLVVTHPAPGAIVQALMTEEIQFAIYLSLLTSITSTFLCIIVGVPAAYALARYDFWGKTLVNMIVDIPLALPPLVAGVGLLLFFGTTAFGDFLESIGLVFVFTPLGIIIAQFFVNLPFMLRIMRSTFEGINPRYEYVAQTLGCTPIQAICQVVLPMSVNGFFAGAVITWAKGIGEFGAALILAGATRMKTETLPISLFLNMSCGELEMAISAATILIAISVVSLYIFEKYGGSAKF
ncbi:ABC transporter permease subunit [Methanoplanus sp. FWC-SCC4]|uniref:ABC transporter permease subunit n=1 Tax=Methanochimaera problematica TaxID=2609417 RepID=A0AA97I425_9EURY|nr:ABC transporter permease [Methanoplanus sp. FWC-SCC4]WOF17278.1 ABC transporter permease subunit [Methanoplanus sp. FWC-SCC4]